MVTQTQSFGVTRNRAEGVAPKTLQRRRILRRDLKEVRGSIHPAGVPEEAPSIKGQLRRRDGVT